MKEIIYSFGVALALGVIGLSFWMGIAKLLGYW